MKSKKNTVRTNITISPEMLEWVKYKANKLNTTKSQIIESALEKLKFTV